MNCSKDTTFTDNFLNNFQAFFLQSELNFERMNMLFVIIHKCDEYQGVTSWLNMSLDARKPIFLISEQGS